MAGILESFFPSIALRREKRRRLDAIDESYLRLAERELAELEVMYGRPDPYAHMTSRTPVEESSQYLGQPWQSELASFTLDQAWRMGFPDLSLAFQYDGAYVARSDSQRLEVLRICRILYDAHPHAKAIVEALVNFVCGPHAWAIEPTPKVLPPNATFIAPIREQDDDEAYAAGEEEPDPEIDISFQKQIGQRLEKYSRRGVMHPQLGWVQFWTEAIRRCLRDGEVFIYLGNDLDDGRLTPRFLEPENIVHPTAASGSGPGGIYAGGIPADPDANGIRVDPDDNVKVLGYWHRPESNLAAMPRYIEADKIIHVKVNVDSTVKRGLPAIFVCRHFLRHFDTWIQQSLKHQKIQTFISILRKWDNATPDAVSEFVRDRIFRKREIASPEGNIFTFRTNQILPVIDAPKGMDMQPFTPNGNYGDSEILARRVLLACGVGEQLSEVMISGDPSNAAYASTRIAHLIPMRHFESLQGQWSETVLQFYERWLRTEGLCGRLSLVVDDCQLSATVTPSKLPNFEGEVVAPVAVQLSLAGIISRRSAQEMVGLDADAEEERLAEEAKTAGTEAAIAAAGLGISPVPDSEEGDEPAAEMLGGEEGEPEEIQPVGRRFDLTFGAKRGQAELAELGGNGNGNGRRPK